jgi:hypothetical protein
MPDLCRQISGPMDLRETAFSRGGATKGEAWMRFCRRLRTELGEDVFSSALVQISLARAGVNIGSGSEHRGPNLRRGFAPHSKPL